MKVVLKSRRGTHYATGDYENNKIILHAGSLINLCLSYEGMSSKLQAMRKDKMLVSPSGMVLKEITFDTPSEAAQFVTGRSTNGYIAWRIDDIISLKRFRETQE